MTNNAIGRIRLRYFSEKCDEVSTLIQVNHEQYFEIKQVLLAKSAPNMKSSRALKEFEFSKITETGWVGSVLMHEVS